MTDHLARLLVISHRSLEKLGDVEDDRDDDDGDEVLGHPGVLVLHQTSVAVLLNIYITFSSFCYDLYIIFSDRF